MVAGHMSSPMWMISSLLWMIWPFTGYINAMEAAGWQVKEMGVPIQFLSLDMKLTLDPNGRCVKINLSQHTYILDLVEQFDLTLAANPRTTTPMSKCTAVDASGQLLPSNRQYISLVGALLYLATCT